LAISISKQNDAARGASRRRPRRFREAREFARSVMPEDCQQNDDRQRNAEQPQQKTSSKAHLILRQVFL
jgi:hypothetical protein